MVGQRVRLLEVVEEPPVDQRNEHARAGEPLLHRLPLLVSEVSSCGHEQEYRGKAQRDPRHRYLRPEDQHSRDGTRTATVVVWTSVRSGWPTTRRCFAR